MSSNIKTILTEYIRIDDELKIINKQSTSLRQQKKLLGEQINDYLQSNAEDNSIIEMGKNTFKVIKYTKKKVHKDTLEEVLSKRIANKEHVKGIIDDLVEETEESYLKRIIKK